MHHKNKLLILTKSKQFLSIEFCYHRKQARFKQPIQNVAADLDEVDESSTHDSSTSSFKPKPKGCPARFKGPETNHQKVSAFKQIKDDSADEQLPPVRVPRYASPPKPMMKAPIYDSPPKRITAKKKTT